MTRPLGKNLLVRELRRSHHSVGGIVHPDSYQEPLATLVFHVVAKGSACDPCIQSGDRVVLDQFHLSSKHPAGEGLWIIKESSVAVVIPANPAIPS
jgi:co-chaperonin GroES (HSP10)